MDELIAFIRARLDEDLQTARELGELQQVFREVEAKRLILAECERVSASAAAYPNNATITALGVAQTILRALGWSWSLHSAYRAEWAPPR